MIEIKIELEVLEKNGKPKNELKYFYQLNQSITPLRWMIMEDRACTNMDQHLPDLRDYSKQDFREPWCTVMGFAIVHSHIKEVSLMCNHMLMSKAFEKDNIIC